MLSAWSLTTSVSMWVKEMHITGSYSSGTVTHITGTDYPAPLIQNNPANLKRNQMIQALDRLYFYTFPSHPQIHPIYSANVVKVLNKQYRLKSDLTEKCFLNRK